MNAIGSVKNFSSPLPTFGGLNAGGGQQSQGAQLEVQMMFLAVLAQFTSMFGGSMASGGGLASASPSFGASSNGNSLGMGGFLGGSTGSGNAAFGGPSSASSIVPAGMGMGGAGGSGQAAVDYARQFNGQDSISLKGKMKHFTAAGGVTNNCVDFVSSALESQGLVKGHHINVKSFEQELKKQGYRQVPASQAKPGDVWINHSRGHTELVATAGATKLIGSNGSARQKVSEHNNRPGSGIIYQRG